MTHDELQQAARDHLLLHFSKSEIDDLLVLERGEGPYVFDTKGNRYIDALSSLFCAQIGYSHGEEMAAAAARQLTTLAFNTNWGTAHPAVDRAGPAAGRRGARRPQPRVLHQRRLGVGRGGVEARAASTTWPTAQPQRTKAIARDVAYHGVTLGALSFTGVRAVQGAVRPRRRSTSRTSPTPTPSARRTATTPRRSAPACCEEVEDAIVAAGPDEVALIIAEPVQNAGGCLVAAARLLDRPARAGRPVRRAADGRRGHHRLRPPGGVVRRSRARASCPTSCRWPRA